MQVGDKVVVLPIRDDATVSRIEHGSAVVDNSVNRLIQVRSVAPVDTTEITLIGIDPIRLGTGCVLSHSQ